MTLLHQTTCLAIRFLKFILSLLGEDRRLRITAQIQSEIPPIKKVSTPHGDLQFFCPEILPLWRAQTFFTKEPETIEWISSFEENETLYDIGANVGIYSLYAASKGHHVLAFEPSAFNYHILIKNTEINQLSHHISAFCLALSNQSTIGVMNMGSIEAGGALHHFGEKVDLIDSLNQKKSTIFSHSMIGYSLDQFVENFNPKFPNHLKIDVDGIEHLIIEGAKNTLQDKRLKSILIELDLQQDQYSQQIKTQIEQAGFELKTQQDIEMHNGYKIANCIFKRPDINILN